MDLLVGHIVDLAHDASCLGHLILIEAALINLHDAFHIDVNSFLNLLARGLTANISTGLNLGLDSLRLSLFCLFIGRFSTHELKEFILRRSSFSAEQGTIGDVFKLLFVVVLHLARGQVSYLRFRNDLQVVHFIYT